LHFREMTILLLEFTSVEDFSIQISALPSKPRRLVPQTTCSRIIRLPLVICSY
jgi:hypothetical protein